MKKKCQKCNIKFPCDMLVRCKTCRGCYDKKCAAELCDEDGNWVIPPTKIFKWNCAECQKSPALMSCDVCKNQLDDTGLFAACGACGRHACGACSGLPPARLRGLRAGGLPWLCRKCGGTPKNTTSSWQSDRLFATEYLRYPALWNPKAKESQVKHAHSQLARDLNMRVRDVLRRCRQFERRFTDLLRRLAFRHQAPGAVLAHAPSWVRDAERQLCWLPHVIQSVKLLSAPSSVLERLAQRVRRAAPGGLAACTASVTRRLAAELGCPATCLLDVWTQTVRVSLHKLQSLTLVGDHLSSLSASSQLQRHEWMAADVALLHHPRRAPWLLGYLHSQVWLIHLLLRLVQQYSLETCGMAVPEHLHQQRWVAAYRDYCSRDLTTSLIVLQRRWWELKVETRSVLQQRARCRPAALQPHHRLLAKRYPYVITRPIPSWSELRKAGQVVDMTEDELQKFECNVEPLPVADDDLILQEAKHFETPDEEPPPPAAVQDDNATTQRMVAQIKRDVEQLKEQDQMQNLKPLQEYSTNMLNENAKDIDDSLEVLKEADPKIASTSIIFESDDEDMNFNVTNGDGDCEVVGAGPGEIIVIESDSETISEPKSMTMADDRITDQKPLMPPKVPLVPLDIQIDIPTNDDVRDQETNDNIDNSNIKNSPTPCVSDQTKENTRMCQDDIDKLRKHLIGYRIPDEDVIGKDLKTGFMKTEDNLIETNVNRGETNTTREIGLDGNPKIGNNCSQKARRGLTTYDGELENCKVEFSIGHDLETSTDLVEPNSGQESRPNGTQNMELNVSQAVGPAVHPRGYKGPLKGRVDDLVWLCTPVSVELEKLPDMVLNNVPATSSRRVSLPDIEQVRRDTRRMLVAQVAPRHRDTPHSLCSTNVHEPGGAVPQRVSKTLSFESTTTIQSSSSSIEVLEDYGILTWASEEEDFDAHISEERLQEILNEEEPVRARGHQHCCLARRHRAYNDMKRRNAARAGRGDHFVDTDVHGAKHGSSCDCCCLHLLSAKWQTSLAALQRRLARSLHELRKVRAETSDPSDSHSSNIDKPPRPRQPLGPAKRTHSDSSDEERLVMDVPQTKKSKKEHLHPKKSSSKSKALLELERIAKQKEEKRRVNDMEKQKKENKRIDNVAKDKADKNDCSESERRKKHELDEWQRQKNSHRRFFQPPGTKDSTVIYMTKKKSEIITKKLGPIQPKNVVNPIESHKADLIKSNEMATDKTPTDDNDVLITKVTTPHYEVTSNCTNSTTIKTLKEEEVPSNVLTNIEKSISPVPMSTSNDVIVTSEHTKPERNVLNGTLLPLPNVYNKTAVSGKNLQGCTSSYFMIYQEPKDSKQISGPTVAIVPFTCNMDHDESEGFVDNIENKSVSQKNSKKMLKNRSLLSGGRLVFEDDSEMQQAIEERAKTASPNIFDEVEPPRITTPPDISGPFALNSISELKNTIPSVPIVAPALPIVIPPLSTPVPTVPVASTLPTMIPTVPVIIPTVPVVVPPLPVVVPTVPVVPEALPSISNARRPSSPIVLDDDDDDECVITSAPTTANKTIVIKRQVCCAPRFIKPETLYREIPKHISTYFCGWETAPFALLRINSEMPLWSLPGGGLVLTDTAVACRNIKYFIINSASIGRMVPVHFDRPAPARARIQVRSFARIDRRSPERSPQDMLTADNKLYKRLADEPPIYARVLTGFTDIMSACLLVSSGYSLHVYSPRLNSLLAVAPAGHRKLRCDDVILALHVAEGFNQCTNPKDGAWVAVTDAPKRADSTSSAPAAKPADNNVQP